MIFWNFFSFQFVIFRQRKPQFETIFEAIVYKERTGLIPTMTQLSHSFHGITVRTIQQGKQLGKCGHEGEGDVNISSLPVPAHRDNVSVGQMKGLAVTWQSRHSVPRGAIASGWGRVAVQPQVRQWCLCTSGNEVTPVSHLPCNCLDSWHVSLQTQPSSLQARASQGWGKVNVGFTCHLPTGAKADLRTGPWPPSLTSELGSGTGDFWCPWRLFIYMLCWWLIRAFLECPVQSL